ncbi:MAG: cob(I)yrinic acid a,c-diamide adenosyltransferase [Chloroflexi bacterium]|nr:cob(I)yrinic acid a,c-diamide adenosyltransferase [Chloroflexota bacterium]
MNNSLNRRGLVQVYTGDGKGKTTAALGQALRAAGRGHKVVMVQFVKGDSNTGEHFFVKKCPFLEILQPNQGNCFVQPREELKAAVDQALSLARERLSSGRYDMVILDEIFIAADMGLVTEADVLQLIDSKPEKTELVLTGRHAQPEVVRRADLVTEMLMIKHPYTEGTSARPGIEY